MVNFAVFSQLNNIPPKGLNQQIPSIRPFAVFDWTILTNLRVFKPIMRSFECPQIIIIVRNPFCVSSTDKKSIFIHSIVDVILMNIFLIAI